jgi:hypothetical protein
MPRDHRDLAIETLAEALILTEQQRDQYRAEAETYRRLALVAIDFARACAITADDGRARDIYADRLLREVA